MTSPPLPGPGGGNRTLRVALLAAVAVAVIGALVAIVVLVTERKSSPSAAKQPSPTPSIATPSTGNSLSPTPSSAAATTDPSAGASLGGLVVSSKDPQVALKTAIATAFLRYNDVVNNMVTTKTQNFGPLYDVAADPLYTAIEEGILQLYSKGNLEKGRTGISQLAITSISSDGQSASLTACADLSGQQTINASTGAVVGSSGNQRIVDDVTMRVRDGRWKTTGLTHPASC